MNKKFFLPVVFLSFLITSCSMDGFFTPTRPGQDTTPKEVSFSISSAAFTDEQGHLRVDYTCNYSSPFAVTGHTFSKINITGVTASELDYSNSGYFTLLSPIINTSLKFEFFDTSNKVYITSRYQNVTPYDGSSVTPPQPDDGIDYPAGYTTLYWSDEFDSDKLDKNNWTYEIGNGNSGWGNNESQYYTDSNDFVSDGYLTIRAKEESRGGFNYTSTRIKTQSKVHFTYGYIEARISLPAIQGMWPAFWMMPNSSVYGGWPHSGEIDIMEAKGRLEYQSSSALHFSTNTGQYTYLSHEQNGHTTSEFNKYAVEWKADSIKYYINEVCHYSIQKNQWGTVNAKSSETAPFDQDFYIILNLAIGGHFDEYRLPPSGFGNADMKVDYVRVFK